MFKKTSDPKRIRENRIAAAVVALFFAVVLLTAIFDGNDSAQGNTSATHGEAITLTLGITPDSTDGLDSLDCTADLGDDDAFEGFGFNTACSDTLEYADAYADGLADYLGVDYPKSYYDGDEGCYDGDGYDDAFEGFGFNTACSDTLEYADAYADGLADYLDDMSSDEVPLTVDPCVYDDTCSYDEEPAGIRLQ